MMSNEMKIMKQTRFVRNVSIIAHVDHGKTSLTESLAHIYTDVGDEKKWGITIKSAAVSLQFKRLEQQKIDYNDEQKRDELKQIEQEYLINLIDSPGHVDFSSEVTAALRITDGAICVCDCIEGVCVQTETVLRQAILERVKPVLFLNKIDRIWLEKHLSEKETYLLFRKTIESINVICNTYYKDGTMGDAIMNPKKLNVAFGSGYFGWGFTIRDFAKKYKDKSEKIIIAFGTDKIGKDISVEKLTKKLWGNNYFDTETKKWYKKSKMDKERLNGFCEYILKPLHKLHDAIMNEESDIYLPIISTLELDISNKEIQQCAKPKDLLKLVMSRWFPTKNCVLDLCADNLPSPLEAQRYRIPLLYTGPLESAEAQDMLKCNPNGQLSMYCSKMIPVPKKPGSFIAFGRVFSGTIKRGQELRILGQQYDDDHNNDDDEKSQKRHITKKKVQGIIMMMGAQPKRLSECSAGNVCGLIGIDKGLTKSGTLCDSDHMFPFKTMKFSVSPIVNCAVNVVNSKHLPKLVEGIQRLIKYDNIIQHKVNKQGQHIISGSGELHLKTCLSTLRQEFMNDIKINTSNPIVSFCEGVDGISGSTKTLPTNIKLSRRKQWRYPNIISAKSPNNKNHIYLSIEPLSCEIGEAIENDKIALKSDMKAFRRQYGSIFNDWNKEDIAGIWSFGCAPYSKSNILVNQTRAVKYLKEVKNSIIEGFRQFTSGGILCDEPLRNCRINLLDLKIHQDPSHRGPGQIIPAMVRACYAALLSATPILYEPMYVVDIDVPIDAENGVFNTLGKVRGEMVDRTDKTDIGIPICRIKAYVPILETLKNDKDDIGFTELLRSNTKGKAFAVMKFHHWQKIGGDVLIKDSMSNKLIMDTRKRKGIKLEIPCFNDYYDKL